MGRGGTAAGRGDAGVFGFLSARAGFFLFLLSLVGGGGKAVPCSLLPLRRRRRHPPSLLLLRRRPLLGERRRRKSSSLRGQRAIMIAGNVDRERKRGRPGPTLPGSFSSRPPPPSTFPPRTAAAAAAAAAAANLASQFPKRPLFSWSGHRGKRKREGKQSAWR